MHNFIGVQILFDKKEKKILVLDYQVLSIVVL